MIICTIGTLMVGCLVMFVFTIFVVLYDCLVGMSIFCCLLILLLLVWFWASGGFVGLLRRFLVCCFG